ncbi:MAG: U32 family peptidase [Bdellovibrionales bacterium]
MMVVAKTNRLTLGPLLFHWPENKRRDFYFRIAEETDIDTVYLGEVICSKRDPFFEPYYEEVEERLSKAGKEVVRSTLALITTPREMQATRDICATAKGMIEANDVASIEAINGKPFVIGPLVNVFNEGALAFLAQKGAKRLATLSELSLPAMQALTSAAKKLNIEMEIPVFGRQHLSISMRCYHARAHGLHKDGCQFVCQADTNGMPVQTLDEQDFIAVNGVQTLSHGYVALTQELETLQQAGVNYFRLSPHDTDMVQVAAVFRAALKGASDATETFKKLQNLMPDVNFINGYAQGVKGMAWEEARSSNQL